MNISVVVLAAVSAGKSTLFNAITLEDYAQTSIKRCTMLPCVYMENRNASNDVKKINEAVVKSNKELYEKLINKQYKLTEAECVEQKFQISPVKYLNILNSEVNFHFYDIPGLNDGQFSEIYQNYVKKNFDRFDVIVFIVNVNDGLNTADEMKILHLITDQIKLQKEKGKTIQLITLVNKCDNMERNDNKLVLDEDHAEMFQQVEKTINQVVNEKGIQHLCRHIIPLCAHNAFLFRKLKRDPAYVMSTQQETVVGFNDMGAKFRGLSAAKKKEAITRIIQDTKFLDDMINFSGFDHFVTALKNVLSQPDIILLNKVIYALKAIPAFTLENLDALYKTYNELYCQITSIGTIYKREVPTYVKILTDKFQEEINKFHRATALTESENWAEKISILGFKSYLTSNFKKESPIFNRIAGVFNDIVRNVNLKLLEFRLKYVKNTGLNNLIGILAELKANDIAPTDLNNYFATFMDHFRGVTGLLFAPADQIKYVEIVQKLEEIEIVKSLIIDFLTFLIHTRVETADILTSLALAGYWRDAQHATLYKLKLHNQLHLNKLAAGYPNLVPVFTNKLEAATTHMEDYFCELLV